MAIAESAVRPRILLVDDEPEFLELYREILRSLSGQPDVRTASSGNRALALLESGEFNLLILDLNMPKMDGLQVLSIARRKYPQLRIVVLTALHDDEFRARAYGMGVDQFWQKPDSEKESLLFREAMEALLRQLEQGGFRGVQSKSLVDILQLESLAQTSGVLRVVNGVLEGRLWLQMGEVIDAEALELTGEEAFRLILGWRTGSFEMLAADPKRERRIFSSLQGLLLETAQAMDEAQDHKTSAAGNAAPASALEELTRVPDVQFVLSTAGQAPGKIEAWGVECPEALAEWARGSMKGFETVGDRLKAGTVQQIGGLGAPSHVVMASSARGMLAVGFRSALNPEELRENMKNLLAKWLS